MAVIAWLTVFTGTWIVYPWYRVAPPEGLDTAVQSVELQSFPRFWLLANEHTAEWHSFGMEWKEHVAWIAPLLATAVAFAVLHYGRDLIRRQEVRIGVIIYFGRAFVAAGVAGIFGAFITKAAPIY
jgi:hypothetical protein